MLPYHDFESLRVEISSRHDSLSNRLRQIAIFALDHPTDMALETIAVIAKRAGVQPSALIRFAKSFGYSGFSEMQKAFQARVVERSASYKERVRALDPVQNMTLRSDESFTDSVLKHSCDANMVSLRELSNGISAKDLETAVGLVENAEHIYIMAQQLSFPVATYLNYAFSQSDYRTFLLDGVGGMLFESAQQMKSKDVLIAITFPPYSVETAKVAAMAVEQNVPILAITDSAISSVAKAANVCLEVQDAEVYSSPSLVASMSIAQTLIASLLFRRNQMMKKCV